MRHLMSPLDFSVEELDQLLNLAHDIELHPEKYAHACDGKSSPHCFMNRVPVHVLVLKLPC